MHSYESLQPESNQGIQPLVATHTKFEDKTVTSILGTSLGAGGMLTMSN